MTENEKKVKVTRLFAYYNAEVAMLGGEAEVKKLSALMIAEDLRNVGKSIENSAKEAGGNDEN